MEFPVTIVKLAGAVALLLWGVHMVGTGVQRAFGAKLRAFLARALRNRFKAFVAGLAGLAFRPEPPTSGGPGRPVVDAVFRNRADAPM